MDEMMHYSKAVSAIAAAITIGVGIFGPALAQGLMGARGLENMGKYPESSNAIRNAMIAAMAITETLAIFCVGVAGALIWFGMK